MSFLGNSLRTDFRQWLIYDEPTTGAVVRALEVMALGMAGRTLSRHRTQSVRALGTIMMRLADARTKVMLGTVKNWETNDEAEQAIKAVMTTGEWIGSGSDIAPIELDELHATVFHLDHRLNTAGVTGKSWVSGLGRGD
jgi:hypothetical protein